jgi:DNA-binding NtrC family response regulator
MRRATILVVDDEQPFCDVLCGVLGKEGHDVTGVGSAEEAQQRLGEGAFDLVICDLRLPGMSGLELLRHLRETAPGVGFMMITAYGDVETAVEAVKLGAVDYLTKPFLFDDIVLRINRLLEHVDLQQSHAALQDELVARYEPRGLVGESASIRELRTLIRRVAPTNSSVLIIGESGTGKEVVARAIHRLSDRRDRRLVTINCAALPDTLLESELFGHAKGAFTGAARAREGHFQAADGGTLFLDEIGAMPARLQSKILRAVEAKEVVPLGSSEPRQADVRILAATSTDLAEASQEGKFMDALYYRLNVFEIRMPPLRDRKEDIPLLVDHFIRRFNEEIKKGVQRASDAAMAMLMAYEWPGNVRELENAIERGMILTDGDSILADALPLRLQKPPLGSPERPLDLRAALRRVEREHIATVLALAGQDKVKAAEMMGISLSSLYRKLEPDEDGEDAGRQDESLSAPSASEDSSLPEAEPQPET